MSASLRQGDLMTLAQYLAWAEGQPDGRFELVDGVPQRMSPELNRHILVKGAVYRAFVDALRQAGCDCVALPDGATVVIHDGKAREPDVSIVGGSSIDLDSLIADGPIVLVEVTSPSTVRTDSGDKLIEYFSLPSVRHYVLVHPLEQKVVHHRRIDGGTIETLIASEGVLRFDPPGFAVEIARFFADLPPGKAH